MPTDSRSRRRRPKRILCRNDGSLYDVSERRRITPTQLRDYLSDGGLFEARRQESGADCTFEVLQGVVGSGLLGNMVPGLGGSGPLSGLGPLGALAGGLGPLGALSERSAGLDQIVRLLQEGSIDRGPDRRWDEEEEPPVRTRRRRRDWWEEEPQRSRELSRHRRDDDWEPG